MSTYDKFKPQPDFKPGLYRHYKGDLYTASMLVQHHERRTWYVVYVSLVHGSWNIRPLVSSAHPDESECAWTDDVVDAAGDLVPRFRYEGETVLPVPGHPASILANEVCSTIEQMSNHIDPEPLMRRYGTCVVLVSSVNRHYRWIPHSTAIPDGTSCVQRRDQDVDRFILVGRFILLP